jgi:hypothetical protein
VGKLLRGSNWYLEVRGREHYPPHFHVIGVDFSVVMEMETLTLREGTLPAAIRADVMAWAAANADRLRSEWIRLNPHLPI